MTEESAAWQELNAKYGPGHRARIIEDAVNQLNTRPLRAIYRQVGSLAYPPELLLKMVLFELLEGRNSPVQWYRDAREHDALKWLGRGIRPARTTWYDFRDRMDKVIHLLNEQLVREAVENQWACPRQAAQDGSTFRSQASRHRTFNRQRLVKRKECVQAAVERDIRGEPPAEPIPKWMPATVSGRWELSERIERGEQQLERLCLENAIKPKNRRRDEKNIVVSLTDPEAPFARDKEKIFCFLFTAQLMVDADSLLILGYSVTPENTDTGTLAPMIDRVQQTIGGTLRQVSADAGYTSVLDLKDCHERSIDLLAPVSENSFSRSKRQDSATSKPFARDQFQWLADEQRFVCPAGHSLNYKTKELLDRHGGRQVISRHFRCDPQHCLACPLAKQCTTHPARGRTIKRLDDQELIDAQREKMMREDIKQIYARRGQIIERAFADAKSHRSYGRLRGRGLRRARAAIGLLVLAQNILNRHRLRRLHKNSEKRRE